MIAETCRTRNPLCIGNHDFALRCASYSAAGSFIARWIIG